MTMISNFLFNFTNFCIIDSCLSKLLTLGILFSTAVRAEIVAKLIILSNLFLTSFILMLKAIGVGDKFAILGISSLNSFILALRALRVVLVGDDFHIHLATLIGRRLVVGSRVKSKSDKPSQKFLSFKYQI